MIGVGPGQGGARGDDDNLEDDDDGGNGVGVVGDDNVGNDVSAVSRSINYYDYEQNENS